MKIAIVGSRYFTDYFKFCECIKSLDIFFEDVVIVSGGADGADKLAEKFADEYSISSKIFYAEWNIYGKSAGPIRNKKIVNHCDFMIAFPSKDGKGTQDSIQQCLKSKKPVHIFELECNGYKKYKYNIIKPF